ncbi:MAG: FKBP-type peptidyl-prolyl cis-trans isomerase [Cyclobacteriaceae bacterium]
MIRKLSIQIFGILLLSSLLTTSCTEDVLSTVDPDIQLELDLEIIEKFISEKGYSNVDTTALGVFYVILDEGTGADILPNDIVSFDMAGRLTDEYVWATTNAQIAQDNGIYDSTAYYAPLVITYTTDGWNISELVSRLYQLETGYRSGVAAVLGKMNVGGHARFIVPSTLAYGSFPPVGFGIPDNAVLVFDIYPTYKR